MELRSAAFDHGRLIPRRHTCDGEDLLPPLAWSDLPPGTVSLALIVDDPDAPGGTFTHWLAWGIDPAGSLAEGERAPREGRNDFGAVGYRGPCPPPRRGRHRYFFRIFALAQKPELAAGASRSELERALAPHLLAYADLVGSYERP
jgi:Raf kinase inhibitor-like YbhB/YbcL family protein